MAIKKYAVREGFTYHERTEDGQERTLFEGNTVDLPEEIGNSTHQLEIVRTKRTKAATSDEKSAYETSGEGAEITESDTENTDNT